MNDHIGFDEMVNFIYSSPNNYSLTNGWRINSHIMKCDKCYDIYNGLLLLKQSVENLDTIYPKNENEFRLYLALSKHLNENEQDDNNKISEWIKDLNNYLSNISISIKNISEIQVTKSKGTYDYNFGHPLAITSRGQKQGIINKTIVVDDENAINRISIIDSDSIKIELDPNDYDRQPTLALLVSKDGNSQVENLILDDQILTAVFNKISLGEYELFIK